MAQSKASGTPGSGQRRAAGAAGRGADDVLVPHHRIERRGEAAAVLAGEVRHEGVAGAAHREPSPGRDVALEPGPGGAIQQRRGGEGEEGKDG